MSWKLMQPVQIRVPMPEIILLAMARYAILAALTLNTRRAPMWWAFGPVLRMGFYGLMRPKEIWNLRRRDIRLPGVRSFLSGRLLVATIRDPKNRTFMGRLQVRAIREERTVQWLAGFWRMLKMVR